ncbi:FliH/SctL family protein [Sneathiella marina]|uniref:FliH/SctL family protein n=1 Tax=Sneathiella marina TaxID=2950108 RepID=A0ABY4W452_9PROT|nr:FliH/SctL family protein [Sneathiella marina]USG60505.1 FliH/SctL family protein [Sneathiella marina]
MNTSTRFLFDREFSDDGASANGAKGASEGVAIYTEQDLATQKQEAFAEGVKSGQDQATQTLESMLASSLDTVAMQLQQLLTSQVSQLQSIKQDAASLALAAASKLAPALIQQSPHSEIEQVIKDCLSELPEEPRIVVRAAEQTCDFLKGKVDELSAQSGFQGNIILLPEEEMQPSECRVEWADGGVERDIQKIENKLTAIINEFVGGNTDPSNLDSEEQLVPSFDEK